MENPAYWNVLTAVLWRCPLQSADVCWKALLELKLVQPAGREVFQAVCDDLNKPGPPVYGLSGAGQVAGALSRGGFATKRGLKLDPDGKRADRLVRGCRALR